VADLAGYQEYTTPDGRTLRLPPALAASFAGSLAPVQQAAPMPDPSAPPAVDASLLQTPPMLGAPPDGPPPAMGPVPGPAPMQPGMLGPAPQSADDGSTNPNAGRSPDFAPGTQPTSPTPPPEPLTPRGPTTAADLRSVTGGQVYDQQRGALAQGHAADVAQVQVDAGLAQEKAKAYQDHVQRQDAIDKQAASTAQANLAKLAQRSADQDAAIEKLANTKIDTSVRHPILAGIGMAMSLLGQAMGATGENQAMAALSRQRDRSVQEQLADRENQGKAIGMRKEQLAGLRQQFTDQGALVDALTAVESRRFKSTIDMLAAGSNDKSVQAKLMKLGAAVAADEVGLLEKAKDKQASADAAAAAARAAAEAQAEARRHTRVSEAQGWAGIGETRASRLQSASQFDKRLAFDREKEANDQKAALAKGSGKDGETLFKLQKENEERAIRDPTTNQILLGPQGMKMRAEAEAIEKKGAAILQKAASEKDPTKKAQIEELGRLHGQKASEMRGEADLRHAIRGRSADHAAKVSGTVNDAQAALSLIDKITNNVDKAGTKILNADTLQSIVGTDIDILGLYLKEAWKLGTLDNGTVDYLNKVTGGDPTKLSTNGVLGALGVGADSAEKVTVKLESIAGALERRGILELGSLGVKPGDFKFARSNEARRPESKTARAIADEKTPIQQSEGEEPGALRTALTEKIPGTSTLYQALGGKTTEERKRAAEESGSLRFPGLSKEQESGFSDLLGAARGGDAAPGARAKLVEMATNTANPSLSNAVLNTLKTDAPDLYRVALTRLPEEQRALRTPGAVAGEKRGQNLADLTEAAKDGDKAATKELIRRMQAGDRDAFAALRNAGHAMGSR
jgi:hypothetical protein